MPQNWSSGPITTCLVHDKQGEDACRAFAVRTGSRALRSSLFAILKNREDEISPRMSDLINGLYEDWLWLDERIETVSREIEEICQQQANCIRLMSIPGIGPLISMVAAIGSGEDIRPRS